MTTDELDKPPMILNQQFFTTRAVKNASEQGPSRLERLARVLITMSTWQRRADDDASSSSSGALTLDHDHLPFHHNLPSIAACPPP